MICMDHPSHKTIVYNTIYATFEYSETNDYNRILYRMITIGLYCISMSYTHYCI